MIGTIGRNATVADALHIHKGQFVGCHAEQALKAAAAAAAKAAAANVITYFADDPPSKAMQQQGRGELLACQLSC